MLRWPGDSKVEMSGWSPVPAVCFSAHGQDLHAGLPPREDAELLREGGAAESGGSAAKI